MLRYLETFFRNRWLVSLPAVVLLLAGATLAVLAGPKYEAAATIWTENSAYLEVPVTNENRYATAAQIQAGRLTELIKSDTFSRAIVDMALPGAKVTEKDKLTLQSLIQKGTVVTTSGDHSVRISFIYGQPTVAVAVIQSAIAEYDLVTTESANAQASEAVDFYKERIKEYEQTIVPRSSKAVTDYLANHPNLAAALQRDPSASDPDFAVIDQQAKSDRDQYQHYKQLLQSVLTQSSAVSKHQASVFRVLDAPALTHDSMGQMSKKTLLLYAGAGTGLCIGYVVLFLGLATELDRTMRNPGDVRRRLQLPVLDVIPDYAPARPQQGSLVARQSKRRQPAHVVQSQTTV